MEIEPSRYRLMTDPAQAHFVREEVRRLLMVATEQGSESLEASGVSFVLMGMGVWAGELAEADPDLAPVYLRALADIFDPNTSDLRKAKAETKRREAFQAFCSAVGAQSRHTDGDPS